MAQSGGPVHLSWEDKTSQSKGEGSKEGFSETPAGHRGSGSHTWKAKWGNSTRDKGPDASWGGDMWVFLILIPSWAVVLGFFLPYLFSLLSPASPSLLHLYLLFSLSSPPRFFFFLFFLIDAIQQLLFSFSLELCCFLAIFQKCS